MANEDRMNGDDAVAEAERIVRDAGGANANAGAENGKDGEHVLGWFYAFDADNDPGDAERLIWVSLGEADGGERETGLHAGDLIKQHAENRPLLLDDIKLLGRALAEYEDAQAKDVTFRRYAFSCMEELPEGVMPIARFTAEVGTSEEGTTVTHRCAINSRLKREVLVGVQRLVAGVIENLPRLFSQLEESERQANAVPVRPAAATADDSGAGASDDAITDIASVAADMAAIEAEGDAAGSGDAGVNRESKVFGYFYAYDMNATIDDSGAIAKIDVDEPDEDGKAQLRFSLSTFITDNVDNCGALLAFVSQLYDVLPRSEENGSIYRRYAFTNRSEPPENVLPLGRIVVELEDGKPVGSHCETAGDERLHDALIGATHIIEAFGPYMRQVLDRKQAESKASGDK